MEKLIFCLFLLLNPVVGYKILVYSTTFSRSHIISNAKIADVLAQDGHDVTLLEVHYEEPLGVIEAAKYAKVWRETFDWPQREDKGDWSAFIDSMFNTHTIIGSHFENLKYHERYLGACEHLLNNTEMIEKMAKEKFDVFIGEQLTMCGSGISHLAKIPIHIWLSSCPIGVHIASLIGLPLESSYLPAVYENDQISDRMSFRQRFDNLLRSFSNYLGFVGGIDDTTALFRRKFGSNFPDIRQIVGRSPLILASVDEFIDYPRPTSARVVNIGGLGLRNYKTKSLADSPFEAAMQRGRLGVIFFSLGSMVPTSMLPNGVMENILRALSHLSDYHFIVRTEESDTRTANLLANLTNVELTHWAPQADLLAHSRIKLFITHAGYNSLMEAARFAVPLLTMGVFGDQLYNSLLINRNGWGRAFDKSELLHSHEKFEATIREVLDDENIKLNAKRIQRLFMTRPLSPENRLTQSIRFLEANDGQFPELIPVSLEMNTIARHNLDLYALMTVSILVVIWMFIRILRFVFEQMFAGLKQKID
ncbi:UDP-glucuronosyl UDP-glucosyltransferase domain containing protein [Aphelenchoides besseyi]|nr:UDP-glucuronosyl UDP-glucosyltransferase domain containing protein [Aphelenchoides besseyi]KAI6193331.1 UDP-glucuronosyl UDP-glucosyltransferase domain containing protein [Aphelenchoides besseyi]